MTADGRPPPMFLADAPGLDVLNTLAAPWGSSIEWLGDGEDLLAWLVLARMVPAPVANAMRADVTAARLDAVAAAARALREWFRGFVTARRGKPIGAEVLKQLGPLNRLLESDEAYGAVVASTPPARAHHEFGDPARTSALSWRWERRWSTPDALLLPIARAMADVVCEADFTQVKQCEGSACTIVFLDTTKGHARRWCSMAVCGNRAKQAAHRARVRIAAENP